MYWDMKKWINDFHSKTDTSLVNIALSSGEPVSASMKTSNLFCFALPLYPAGGLRPPVPVTFSYSPATWNLFDNPDYWLIWLILNIGLVWLASSTKRLVPLGFLSQCFYGIVQNKRLWQKWQHYFNAFCVTFLSISIEIKFFIWIFITCRVLMSIWILCWTMLKKSI